MLRSLLRNRTRVDSDPRLKQLIKKSRRIRSKHNTTFCLDTVSHPLIFFFLSPSPFIQALSHSLPLSSFSLFLSLSLSLSLHIFFLLLFLSLSDVLTLFHSLFFFVTFRSLFSFSIFQRVIFCLDNHLASPSFFY